MPKKATPDKPVEVPQTPLKPEVKPPDDPEEPFIIPEEDPDFIPEEEPFEEPPYEVPSPGEGP